MVQAIQWDESDVDDVEKQAALAKPLQCHAQTRDGEVGDVRDSLLFLSTTPSLASVSASKPGHARQGSIRNRRTGWRFFGHVATVYGCLFGIVVAANLVAVIHVISTSTIKDKHGLQTVNLPVTVNFMFAVLSRNEHFVNTLFRTACVRPTRAPFIVRAALSQVHNYGGLHSGCAVAAVLWYCLETVSVTLLFMSHQVDAVSLAVTWVILVFLGAIVLSALPPFRRRIHDWFEVVHRFAGWSVVILIWVQVVCLGSGQVDKPAWRVVLTSSATWFLVVATVLLAYPWLRLRNVTIRTTKLSDHALQLHFDGSAGPCTAVKLSSHPLRENHPFACIPQPQNPGVFSVIVSEAGDWTSRLIESPPESIWIRRMPQRGVLWVARMFSPVVIVATGSGIGPCLGLFNGCQDLPCRVLWSTRRPAATYGDAIIARVQQADANAMIIDTDQCGRPDLPKEAERLYRETGAEAVVVISNRDLTYKVVSYLSQRGICARGPIWDS